MDLNDVLNDIQSDLEPLPNSPSDEVSPEKINAAAQSDSADGDDTPDPALVQAVENFKTCLIYRKALNTSGVVAKSLATEIFTMLPEMNDALLSAKLTNAASAHNKTMLLGRLDKYQPSPESMLPMFSQLQSMLEQTQLKLKQMTVVIAQTMHELDEQIARTINTAVVVFCRKTYNLYTAPLCELVQIDDRLIDFAPYEGKLVKAIEDIACNSIREVAPQRETGLSFEDVINYLRALQSASLQAAHSLEEGYKNLAQFDEDLFTQTDFQRMVRSIDTVNRITRVFSTEPALVEACLKFLRLLV